MPDLQAQFLDRNDYQDRVEDMREASLLMMMDLAAIAFHKAPRKSDADFARETVNAMRFFTIPRPQP